MGSSSLSSSTTDDRGAGRGRKDETHSCRNEINFQPKGFARTGLLKVPWTWQSKVTCLALHGPEWNFQRLGISGQGSAHKWPTLTSSASKYLWEKVIPARREEPQLPHQVTPKMFFDYTCPRTAGFQALGNCVAT